jgi:hypothetical protein
VFQSWAARVKRVSQGLPQREAGEKDKRMEIGTSRRNAMENAAIG